MMKTANDDDAEQRAPSTRQSPPRDVQPPSPTASPSSRKNKDNDKSRHTPHQRKWTMHNEASATVCHETKK
jgi:hypothetical protein